MAGDFERGVLAGLLIGEGHFGGDGRQPQITLRMHVRHEALFRWIDRTFPGGKLYGPYDHGGRHYLQWMARGTFLREQMMPLLESALSPDLDVHSWGRFQKMRTLYARRLGLARASAPGPPDGVGGRPAAARSADEVFAGLRQVLDTPDANFPNSSAGTLDPNFTDGEYEGP
jgi:hypothetical protein